MLAKRAVEIFHSPTVTEVTYKNNAIWIENIDEYGTAQIKDLKTNKIDKVFVAELEELKH
jgi:H-type small acid-soluble spore protein